MQVSICMAYVCERLTSMHMCVNAWRMCVCVYVCKPLASMEAKNGDELEEEDSVTD